MRLYILFIVAVCIGFSSASIAQESSFSNKGKMYFYWGWNWSGYSKSDIHLRGDSYDFTLSNVRAYDRQSAFSTEKYLNPKYMTIPQYNFRLGYFISDHWELSFGVDHMKYVVEDGQTVAIDGAIAGTGTLYDGLYVDERIKLTPDFFRMEHTDGLNYLNLEARRMDKLYAKGVFSFRYFVGGGLGVLYPKTKTHLFGAEGYDEFQVSGWGVSAAAGLNVTVWDRLFVQTEVKGGYINLPRIVTSSTGADKADQTFWFDQININIGMYIPIISQD